MTTSTVELSVAQAWEHLRTEKIGRLITLIDGAVDVYPINYVCSADTIVLRTHPGSKLFGVAVFRDVVFEVDHYDPAEPVAWSVVIHAMAHIDTRISALADADAADLHPIVDIDADDLIVLKPYRVTAREFTLHS
ncbi:pyridoxamine 5'-phosphate oxidase family protein [Gordonia sp. TBRC 11910]|uniref:Pyridoxamine 5'-phosphate oxidase family protein n=1 Tax=Gordonia asplenii TaxID=2725283 RepID=A0A848KRL3_9ACTN|nr:pyridoxamine 5'-phosphate oxidase family protein [Gordonia asplenii]NMO01604.1 pyridoxamine 5'-phosphate oxidase family protein [Gordonia asplenii]